MTTNKSLSELVNETLKSRMNPTRKAEALVKLGVTPYEAMVLARSSMPAPTPRSPRARFAYTFGVEMETYDCPREDFLRAAGERGLAVVDHLSQYNGCHRDIQQFKIVPDSSLSGCNTAECVTPALIGNAAGFESLKTCCEALQRVGAKVNKSCGLHVHIGARDLTEQQYCNVFLNYQRLERAIDSFMAESRRSDNSRWCRSLRAYGLASCTTRAMIARELHYDRYHKVNAEAFNRHQTIEFRQHQGSVNFAKIKAWVTFLAKLVEWSRANRLEADVDRIEDIPFLTKTEKRYFASRREALRG